MTAPAFRYESRGFFILEEALLPSLQAMAFILIKKNFISGTYSTGILCLKYDNLF